MSKHRNDSRVTQLTDPKISKLPRLTYANYIGRVGGLAVALGIGVAIANSPAIALAEPDSSTNPSGSTASDGSSPQTSPSTSAESSSDKDNASTEAKPSTSPESSISSSGGAHTSTPATGKAGDTDDEDDTSSQPVATESEPEEKSSTSDSKKDAPRSDSKRSASSQRAKHAEKADARTSSVDAQTSVSRSDHVDDVVDSITPVDNTAKLADVSTLSATTSSVEPPTVAPEPSTPSDAVATVVASLLSPTLDDAPAIPVDPPASLAMLAWARSRFDQFLADERPNVTTDPGQTSLVVEDASMASFTALATTAATDPVLEASIPVQSDPLGMAIYGDFLYVANHDSDTVSVINRADNTVVKTINVGNAPVDIAVNTGGTRVYVTNEGSNTVTVIDTTNDFKIAATITVGAQPTAVAVRPDGKRVYVTNTGGRSVSVIDPLTNKRIGTISVGTAPREIAFSPDGKLAFVANYGSGSVSVINTSNGYVTGIRVGSAPAGVAVTPSGQFVYVTNGGSNTVSVIDVAKRRVVTTIPVSSQPRQVVLSPDGTRAYVAGPTNGIIEIDTSNNTVVRTIPVDPGHPLSTQYLAISPNGGRIYLTDGWDNTVHVVLIDPSSEPPIETAPVAGDPAYTIHVVDPSTGKVKLSVNVTDEDGDTLTYTVTQRPANGAVTFDPTTKQWTYTATTAARLTAGLTSGADADTFIVTVSDGQDAVNVAVTVPITAAELSIQGGTPVFDGSADGIVRGPDGLYYATNFDGVYEIYRSSSPFQIPVASSAGHALAISPDGKTLYVAGNSAVTVVDTATRQIVGDPIPVGSYDGGLAVSPDGRLLFAANRSGNTVSIVDTETRTIVGNLAVSSPAGLTLSPDSKSLYVASGSGVAVIDIATKAVVRNIETGSSGDEVAVSPDGTKLYVTNGFDGIAIIDVATGSVGFAGPRDGGLGEPIGVSPDGSVAYFVYTPGAFSKLMAVRTSDNEIIAALDFDSIGIDKARSYIVDLEVADDGQVVVSTLGESPYGYDADFVLWVGLTPSVPSSL